MAPSLLFITELLSKPLAALQPIEAIAPPSPSLLPSPPVCLSPSRSHSVPAPAGLRDQEPGLPWQLVLSLSLDGSSMACVPSSPPTPVNAHTKQTHTPSSSPLPLSTGFFPPLVHFLLLLFICHLMFSLSQPGHGAEVLCGSWVRWNKPLSMGLFKWSCRVSHGIVGFPIMPPRLAKIIFSRDEWDVCSCPSLGERGRFKDWYLCCGSLAGKPYMWTAQMHACIHEQTPTIILLYIQIKAVVHEYISRDRYEF